MFGLAKKKDVEKVQEETKNGFSAVRKDMDVVGKWIRHLDAKDKQLSEIINEIKWELSSIRDEIGSLREGLEELNDVENQQENKQVFKKLPVLNKQSAVEVVQNVVQTAVQTPNIFDFLKTLSANERLLVFTILNSEMKLSYEDLALLLGKEKSTVRGQINAIKQKSEGLIEEISERNGKKRVYIPNEIREKLQKYAKVRVRGKKNSKK